MSRPRDHRIPYLPGIDALRALAVLAVFLYHAGVEWAPGGFLGVDVFFVISGYLITSLLLREMSGRGHIDLGRFWLRRARRLLPAVGVFVAVTIVVAAIADPAGLDRMRVDAIASLAYFANWHFVLADVSYFEQFQRPSLFTHLWSLSVEEQFYLFWPILFAVGMTLLGRCRLLLGVLAGALASVALAWLLFEPGGDASRVYYGTDTHAVGLLTGVALALVWAPGSEVQRRLGGRWLDCLGALGLALVALAVLRVHDYDAALWHGGYLALAVATAALVAALASPRGRLGALLGSAPLVWLGLRSYSFYLWHWPLLALTRPGVDVELPTEVLVPLQLAATLVLADLSYRFVEQPFRVPRRHSTRPGLLRVARPALMALALTVVVAVGWSGVFSSGSGEERAAASLASSATVRPVLTGSAPAPDGAAGATSPPRGEVATAAGRPPALAAAAAARARAEGPPRIVALGDSVMIGARDELARRLGPRFSMSATVGRQADEFVAIVERLRRQGHRPDAVVVHMGNNGPLYGEQMAAMQRATADVGELFLINDRAPVSWVDQSNHAIDEASRDWPHTTLIDWHRRSGQGEGLLWDEIHLTPRGARAYARLVAAALRERFPWLAWDQRRRQRAAERRAARRDAARRRAARRARDVQDAARRGEGKPERANGA